MTWMSAVFTEGAALVFYASTGYLFRPQARNPYLALGKDEDDAPEAEMAEL
jgi:cbb3-type cytochrome oxidase subunit 3